MPVDRSTILREAEQLMRQGHLTQAVEVYVRALDQDPRDSATATRVADLCLRLGQPDQAMRYLMRPADGLREAGRSEEASALYERILALDPQPAPDAAVPDLDAVFAGFRRELEDSAAGSQAEAQLASGTALIAAGRIEEGLHAVQQAARVPSVRFMAAALAARTCRTIGEPRRAVEWFERALEGAPPGADAAHALLYELADTLEGIGEDARALANFLELQSEAGPYRDVAARIHRLTGTGTRG